MLALAVLGALVVASPPPAAADTALRVPGTALRFGLADSLAAARVAGPAPVTGGSLTGRCRFFGLDSEARLGFVRGRLARAEFTVAETSPRQRDYVADQLAAMGYRRRCGLPAPNDCEWTGRTRVRLSLHAERLQAVVTPPETRAGAADTAAADGSDPPPGAIPDAAAGPGPGSTVAGTPAGPVPTLPETLRVAGSDRTARSGEAVVIEAPRCAAAPELRPDGAPPRVRVLALVDTDGRVLEATVSRGLLPPLDAAALDCVRRWRFEPITHQGAPCRFRVELPVTLAFD